ncbi:MAG: ABC transporter ATP-binding protein [Phycisphaerae bacterium]|nr:ABC transporter ATP-binding protein [Phycisphaerae bacterium]
MDDNGTLLSVRNLSTYFFTEEGVVRAVQDVGFSVRRGRTFALVGESGCGKTAMALSIMRLIRAGQGRITGGEIIFEGQDLLKLSERRMRAVRGNRIAMIFQEPMSSLNPVYPVGEQVGEAMRLHQNKGRKEARAAAVEMLRKVGIGEPERRAREYPHQFSGGMCQRVMIAMAVSCEPALLIADEPTTALDVTTEGRILDLLGELQKENGMSILLITHDLGVVAERADEIGVMYASRIVETADSQRLFAEPLHPYTRGLLASLPRLGFSGKRLPSIPGSVPDPLRFPAGCKFHPRCREGRSDERCRSIEPELREVEAGRCVACWHAGKLEV